MNTLRRFTISAILLSLLAPALAEEKIAAKKPKTGVVGTFVDEKLEVNKQERLYRLARRLAHVQSGRSIVTVGHEDLVAWPTLG